MKLLTLIISIFISYSIAQAQASVSVTVQEYEATISWEEDPNEGKIPVSEQEVPKEVMEAFETSVFQHMDILQVFRLQDRAIDEIIVDDPMAQPFYLFEFRLRYKGKTFCQYFTPSGDLYERHRPV